MILRTQKCTRKTKGKEGRVYCWDLKRKVILRGCQPTHTNLVTTQRIRFDWVVPLVQKISFANSGGILCIEGIRFPGEFNFQFTGSAIRI